LRERSFYQPAGVSASGTAYTYVFVRRVHTLLGLAYGTLTPSEFVHAEEEDITGELVRAVEAVLDDADSPEWVGLFSVHEDPRVHDSVRRGKRRRRLDIRIDSSQTRPRPRFRFEAKRLGPGHGVSVYLGKDGLECFLDGRYAREDIAAGMLGYIQAGNPRDWDDKIAAGMKKAAKEIGLLKSSPWRSERLVAELEFTYRSGHARPKVGRPIEIFHTLLPFN